METSAWHDASFGVGSFVWSNDAPNGRLILDKSGQYAYEPFPEPWFTTLKTVNGQEDDVARNVFSAAIGTWSPITTTDTATHAAATEVKDAIKTRFYQPVDHSFACSVEDLFGYTSRFYAAHKSAYRMRGQLIGASQDFDKHKQNAFAGIFAFVLDTLLDWEPINAKAYAVHTFQADHEDAVTTYQSMQQLDDTVVTCVEELTTELAQVPIVRKAPDL